MNQVLEIEKELELLKNAFNLAQQVTVVGARQGGILATLGDNIGAVANSLFAKIELSKQPQVNEAPKSCCKEQVKLSVVQNIENGEVKQEETATQ